MKNLLAIVFLILVSCKPCQKIKSDFMVNETFLTQTDNCPDNGVCSIELIPNKSLAFKTDNIGIQYPVISEGEKTILKYTFSKKSATDLQDGHYTEIVYAELDKNISEIALTNNDLKKVKLYFGRLCYCKGETGYFPIKKGKFKIQKAANNSLQIECDFEIDEVPQIISKISETLSLKSNQTK